jgi:hypothetical protein
VKEREVEEIFIKISNRVLRKDFNFLLLLPFRKKSERGKKKAKKEEMFKRMSNKPTKEGENIR